MILSNAIDRFTYDLHGLVQHQSLFVEEGSYQKGYYDALQQVCNLLTMYKLGDTSEYSPKQQA